MVVRGWSFDAIAHTDIVVRYCLWCLSTYLAVVERLFLGAGLDEELVRQRSVLCAVTIAVRGNPACLPVGIKSSLKTYVEKKKSDCHL